MWERRRVGVQSRFDWTFSSVFERDLENCGEDHRSVVSEHDAKVYTDGRCKTKKIMACELMTSWIGFLVIS